MASITTKPVIESALLNALTASNIWGETELQYFFGDETALTLDTEFADAFHKEFAGRPDQVFWFGPIASAAYASISSFSGLELTQTTDTSLADVVAVSSTKSKSEDLEGFFQFPGMSHRGPEDSWQLGVFNSALPALRVPAEMGAGQYAAWTVFHEIGHSMGLKHTFLDKRPNPEDPLPDVGKALDNERYSVMSYTSAFDGYDYGHVVSYMALDIASLQALYGASDNATGNSTYKLLDARRGNLDLTEGNISVGRALYCIWDSGGDDTISYSGAARSVMINLNAATLDITGNSESLARVISVLKDTHYFDALSRSVQQDIVNAKHNAGGSWSEILLPSKSGFVANAGGYSIAHGAMIENATGGMSADLLIGNEGNNLLTGQDGRDTIIGGDGNDILLGGRGHDVLIGGLGADTFMFSGGRDEVKDFNAAEGDVLVGNWPM